MKAVGEGLSVMVYMHGGGLMTGSGRDYSKCCNIC